MKSTTKKVNIKDELFLLIGGCLAMDYLHIGGCLAISYINFVIVV